MKPIFKKIAFVFLTFYVISYPNAKIVIFRNNQLSGGYAQHLWITTWIKCREQSPAQFLQGLHATAVFCTTISAQA
jgi:hypothetical protein